MAMIPTNYLRFVQRPDGPVVKAILQQWFVEKSEHQWLDPSELRGKWRDVTTEYNPTPCLNCSHPAARHFGGKCKDCECSDGRYESA
jgi:hypothetical protein